ncbi:MAG: hypothetical protein IMF05_14380 [Proteobacteria bacterium]|nr:hypothetical protein [Pseudomonadota bacterium]
MLMEIERLRLVSDLCQEGKPMDEGLANWFGGCLRDFLERRTESFEEAFGLPSCRGGVPWWKEERMRRRDKALRMLARSLPAGRPVGALAREIHQMSKRYAASAWRIDRDRAEMPAVYEGTPREHLWQAFPSGASMPLGDRQLRNIIA